MDAQETMVAMTAFGAVLVVTFLVAWKGHIDSVRGEKRLAEQELNRWLVALSAGATANSGFVVTGAVGLGYSYGVYWLLLPLGWLLGDLFFWAFFPHRINSFGREANATTLTDLLAHGLSISRWHPLVISSTSLVIVCLGGYTMSQWVAGQKFLDGALEMPGRWTLVLFALAVTAYSALGQFRGSVYADTFQAITRMAGTLVVFGAVCWAAASQSGEFASQIRAAGSDFLDPLGGGTIASALGFMLGYAAAALGYGLGQPQVTSRYLAARDADETRAARWIYISYVQFTWATMTLFGILLRGVMPGIPDPEQGLTVFAAATLPPILVGLIVADMFGAIASTANSVLIAMAQAVRDVLPTSIATRIPFWSVAFGLGLLTLLASVLLEQQASVFTLAITAVSLMAAGLAPAVAIKVLGWRHTATSITASILIGVGSAVTWIAAGLSASINESAIGIAAGLLTNALWTLSQEA